MNDNNVLCGCSSYEQKYYFNERYGNLPQFVKDELHIMCVLFTEEISGELVILFDEDGSLLLSVSSREDDFFFDEIGSALKIKKLRIDKAELFGQLEEYYKAMREVL